jgi:hypothetical protein
MSEIYNLRYPKNLSRSEENINTYYNQRELQLQAQYESRARDIDTQIYDNDEKLGAVDDYYYKNDELADQQKILLQEYEQSTQGITELEQQAEIKRSRYYALEELWSQTEDANERARIKEEAIQTATELQQIEDKIRTAEMQNRVLKQNYWDETQKIQAKILSNNKKISKLSELEENQGALSHRKARLAEELQVDLDKNEKYRQSELKNINVPILNTKVKKYASGPVSKNKKRVVVIPFTISIDYPQGVDVRDIPPEEMDRLGIEAFDLVSVEYVTPNPTEMTITDRPPSGEGLDVYDYERSSYASDFSSIQVFFDYGVFLGYTRLEDDKNYAPPRE